MMHQFREFCNLKQKAKIEVTRTVSVISVTHVTVNKWSSHYVFVTFDAIVPLLV